MEGSLVQKFIGVEFHRVMLCALLCLPERLLFGIHPQIVLGEIFSAILCCHLGFLDLAWHLVIQIGPLVDSEYVLISLAAEQVQALSILCILSHNQLVNHLTFHDVV